MSALMLYGLAVFLFLFGVLPYWFKLHKHLNEILGCKFIPIVSCLEIGLNVHFQCQGWALTFPNGEFYSIAIITETYDNLSSFASRLD